MKRRAFLQLLTAGIGGIALEQAIPFNRVWSFPSKILIPEVEVLQPTAIWFGMQDISKAIEENAGERARRAAAFWKPWSEAEIAAAMKEGDPSVMRPIFDRAKFNLPARHVKDRVNNKSRIIDYRKFVLTDA
jgi:hypothetical protein